MVYSKIAVRPSSGLLASIFLNQEYNGWAGQIIGGSFGSNTEYNFTGNVVTTVTDKPIDINVRLTPTVPIPKTPARYYLNTLSNGKTLQSALPMMISKHRVSCISTTKRRLTPNHPSCSTGM